MDAAAKPDVGVWMQSLFERIDASDTEGFLDFLTDDAEFVFGSAPPVAGRSAIGEAVDGFFSSIASSRHELKNIWVPGDTRIVEGLVHYERKDGNSVTLPFTDVFDMRGDRILSYRIYIDIAPLFAV